MAIAASLVVRISTEYGSFVRGMKQAEKDLTRFGKQAKRLGKDLSTDLTLPIVALGAVLFKVASDLERTESMFEATFGGMAASARDWSEQTANALGLSADDIRVTMARFNELATSMDVPAASALVMSKSLTQLTLDLMAYRNISEETASGALEAALAGRMKGLRELGVVVKETDVKETAMRVGLLRTGQTMTAQQTAVASLITMTTALSKANGEMARAGDKPAVMLVKIKQRADEVAQAMGTALMPGMLRVMGAVLALAQRLKELAEWFGRLPTWVRNGTVALAGFLALIGPILWGVGSLILLFPKIKMAFVLAFGPMAMTMGLVTVAIVAMGAAVLAAASNWTAFKLQVILAHTALTSAIWGTTESVLRAAAALATAMGKSGVGTMLSAAADAVAADQEKILAGRLAEINRLEAELNRDRTPVDANVGAGPRRVREFNAMIAAANAAAEAERRLAEARAKFAPGRDTKLTKDLAVRAQFGEHFPGAKPTDWGGLKAMMDAMKNAQPVVSTWARLMEEEAAAVEARFEQMANNITDSLTNLFSDVLMRQAGAFQRFLQTIERMLADFAARQAVNAIGAWIGEALLGGYSPTGGMPSPSTSLVGARAQTAGGDSFHVSVSFAPNFIDGRSGAAWLRENEGVITEAVINGVRKSGAARQALVGR